MDDHTELLTCTTRAAGWLLRDSVRVASVSMLQPTSTN
jgi:hypothetical protein